MHSTGMSELPSPDSVGGLGALWRRYLLSGDEDSMDEVVRRTRRRLLAVARRIGDPADAEDVVQSAYLSLLRRGDAVADVPVLPWLLTASIRLAYRRKAQKRRDADVARSRAKLSPWRRTDSGWALEQTGTRVPWVGGSSGAWV